MMVKRRLIALIALSCAYLETAWAMRRSDIYILIDAERERQDEIWGGRDHDVNHDGQEWLALIVKQIGKLAAEWV